MPDPIVFPSAWANSLVRPMAPPVMTAQAPRVAATRGLNRSAPRPRPAPATSGTISVSGDVHLPAHTAIVVPIVTTTARSQVRGTHALLADPATHLHGLFIRSSGRWLYWRRDDGVPLPGGIEAVGMATVSGPTMPALVAQVLADGVRVVTGNALLLNSLLGRLGWPAPMVITELGALLRSLNQPADTVGMAVHLLRQPITPVRMALADHRWRAEEADAGNLAPAVEHAWLTARVHAQVAGRLDGLLGYEAAAWTTHERINAHGALVDRTMARRCAAVAKQLRTVLMAKAQACTATPLKAKTLFDLKQVQALLAPLGVQVSNLSVPYLEMTITRLPKDLPQREAAQWILAAVIVCHQTEGDRFLKLTSYASADDVLRGAFVFSGAHPGRWTSEGAQLQNLKRSGLPATIAEEIIIAMHEAEQTGDAMTAAEAAILAGRLVKIAGPDHAHACLSGLQRLCFMSRPERVFAIADLSIIELRILNWLAEDARVLAKLADPEHDAHVATAECIWQDDLPENHPEYDLRRNLVAKKVNHGFGFGLSAEKADEKARDEWGIDLSALKLSGAHLHEVYHRRFPRVRTLWGNLIAAAVEAIRTGASIQTGPVVFRLCVFGLAVSLPSGRVMVYADARVERDEFDREVIVYTKFGTNGTRKERTLWGSKLAQHLCEAVGRDLLVSMMQAIQAAGYEVALHAHDELVVEVPEMNAEKHLKVVERIMSTTPGWATGLPLAADGHLSRRFSKKPLFMA